MSVLAFEVSSGQVGIQCGECGITFTVPAIFQKERRETGKTWFCPNGHSRVYRESDVDALKKKLEQKERDLEFERQRATSNFEARQKAEKRLRKIERRTSCGVCPECNRTFVALGRHMKTKHPGFIEAATQGGK